MEKNSTVSESNINLDLLLPPEQKQVANFLHTEILPNLPKQHFFLVGGTAISLKYGHRQSIDFDFFSFPQHKETDPQVEAVDYLFRKHGIYYRQDFNPIYGQQHYLIDGVGITFMSFQNSNADTEQELYHIPTFPTKKLFGFETLDIRDLGALKAFARCQRSKMKDIVDLAELLRQKVPMQEIISTAEQVFGYDFSAKEFVNACLNTEDVWDNALDEKIDFVNAKNVDFYTNLLKSELKKYYV